MTEQIYFAERTKLATDLKQIEEIEERYTKILLHEVILPAAEDIYQDFTDRPFKLLPFWMNYPPEQRGRQPIGNSTPWLELGEKTIGSNLIKRLSERFADITFPGLPTGGDIRFATENVYVHLDIKLTGPNDNPNEVVVPPNQVSGDGKQWNNGILNSSYPVTRRSTGEVNYNFQPKLPPFYILDGKTLLCLTFFLDAIYSIIDIGHHPHKSFEFSCVPNGLIMFDGPLYCNTPGLFIAGKDDNTKSENNKRVRVRMEPLAKINNWRTTIIYKENDGWTFKHRR